MPLKVSRTAAAPRRKAPEGPLFFRLALDAAFPER